MPSAGGLRLRPRGLVHPRAGYASAREGLHSARSREAVREELAEAHTAELSAFEKLFPRSIHIEIRDRPLEV
jgi:hypothetical protein